jgi:catechol 2,3-dioxygenase-like lactoylglutathione lyase family enzyme
MGLSHLRFLVDDLAPDIAFYRETMRFRQIVDVPGVYAEFDTGGARLAFYSAQAMTEVLATPLGSRRGDDLVVCLRVPDVDDAIAQLATRGVRPVREPHDQPAWYQRVAHLRDARGRLLELWSPLPKPAR